MLHEPLPSNYCRDFAWLHYRNLWDNPIFCNILIIFCLSISLTMTQLTVSMSRDVGRHWAASSAILRVMEWTSVPEKIASLQNLPIFMIFASALSDQIIVLGQIHCLIKKCFKTEQIYIFSFIALLNRIYNATFICCSLRHTISDCWVSRPILTSFLHSAVNVVDVIIESDVVTSWWCPPWSGLACLCSGQWRNQECQYQLNSDQILKQFSYPKVCRYLLLRYRLAGLGFLTSLSSSALDVRGTYLMNLVSGW